MPNPRDPRRAVSEQLRRDLGVLREEDVTTAVLCAEMGCGEMGAFIEAHADLACPYAGHERGAELCTRIREVYAEAAADV